MAKRRFSELRNLILLYLSNGKKTINAISKNAGINWKTVDNHLTFLMGKGLVEEVFSSPYVRIFQITEKGQQVADRLSPKGMLRFVEYERENNEKISKQMIS